MPKPTIEPIPSAAVDGTLIQLTLDKISLDPITDVRTGPVAKDESAKIDSLARSIYEQGQLQPIVVRPDANGGYLLVAGRRRYAAKQLIATRTNEAVTIDALVVSKTDEEAWAASLQENLQRRQFSPIELAQNIIEIRKRKGLEGDADWSKHVADFLLVSRATVTQHAKLLDLPADIRAKVHKGDLSAQSAFDLYSVKEDKRAQVLAEAEELAEAEAIEEAAKPRRRGKAEKAEAEVETGKTKRKHILEAARKNDALTQVKPLTRGEILGFWERILESTDPYPDAICEFAKTLLGRWATGHVGDRALLNKLDSIAEIIGDKPVKAAKPRKGAAA